MNKETIDKPDGRYIIYYSFEEGEPEGDAEPPEEQPDEDGA